MVLVTLCTLCTFNAIIQWPTPLAFRQLVFRLLTFAVSSFYLEKIKIKHYNDKKLNKLKADLIADRGG